MKEKIFDDMNAGPFRAKVDERYHKLGQDCPDNGWVTGYLYRDLCGGEIVPIIFNAPCRWRVQEETIEPVGFHIAQWIKVEDRLPEYNTICFVRTNYGTYRAVEYIAKANSDKGCFVTELGILYCEVTHWMPIVPPKED